MNRPMKPCHFYRIFDELQKPIVEHYSATEECTEMDALEYYIQEHHDVMEKTYIDGVPYISFTDVSAYNLDVYVCDMRNNMGSVLESSKVMSQKKYKLTEYLKKIHYRYGMTVSTPSKPIQEESIVTEGQVVKLNRQSFKVMTINQLSNSATKLMRSDNRDVYRFGEALQSATNDDFGHLEKYFADVSMILFIGGDTLKECMPYIISSILYMKNNTPTVYFDREIKNHRKIVKGKLKPKDDSLKLYYDFLYGVINSTLRIVNESVEIPEVDEEVEPVTEANKKRYSENFGKNGPKDYTEDLDEEDTDEEEVDDTDTEEDTEDTDGKDTEDTETDDTVDDEPMDYTEDLDDDEPDTTDDNTEDTSQDDQEDVDDDEDEENNEENEEDEEPRYSEDFGEDGPSDYTEDITGDDTEDTGDNVDGDSNNGNDNTDATTSDDNETTDNNTDNNQDTVNADTSQTQEEPSNDEDNVTDSTQDTQQDDNGLDDGPTDYTNGVGSDSGDTENSNSDNGTDGEEGDDTTEDNTSEDDSSMPSDDSSEGEDRETSVKNYNIRLKLVKLAESIEDILVNLSKITYRSSIQNSVLERGIDNITKIKEQVISYMEFNLTADYKQNLYYYTIFMQALQLNLDMLTKNSTMSNNEQKDNK